MEDGIPLVEQKKPTLGDFVRSGSCIGDPQTNALGCIKARELPLFTDIINGGIENDTPKHGAKFQPDYWINKPLGEEERKLTLLEVAVKMDLPDFVSVLLRAGADASLPNPGQGFKSPIHVAAENKALKAMEMLFQYPQNLADVNALVKSTGRTALHLCVEQKFDKGVRFLLTRPDVQIDVKDKKGGQTPLYLAVKSEQEEIVRMLIERGASLDVTCSGKTIRTWIEDKMPYIKPDTIECTRGTGGASNEDGFEKLKNLIEEAALTDRSDASRNNYLNKFRAILNTVDRKDIDQIKFGGGVTLLIKACQGELSEFVEALCKDGGADVNYTPTGYRLSPLLVAAKRGDCETLKVLISFGADLTATAHDTGETILHCILSQNNPEDATKLHECIKYLLDPENRIVRNSMKKIINKRGDLRNTALHHASRLWPDWTIRSLLELGANIGMKNHWDEVPISHIPPQTVEDFLNDFCIKYDDKLDVNHDKFEITFDYSFLAPPNEDLPPEIRQYSAKVDVEETEKGLVIEPGDNTTCEQDPDSKYPLPETDSLWYLSQSKQHRHLLKHPVITSFLWLKWTRIRRFFNRNLRFYLLFVFILTWHIFETFGGKSIKTDDQDTIPFFYGLYIFFGIIMVMFLFRDWKTDVYDKVRSLRVQALHERDEAEKDVEYPREKGISCRLLGGIILSNWMEAFLLIFLVAILYGKAPFLWTALLILVGLLVARELTQVAVSLKRYVLEVENWIEVATIVLTLFILFYKGDGDDNEDDLRRHMAGIAIVLSWAELITLVGKHPKLTTCNIYVVMFYKVMVTFFFFLLWYAFFIVAFGLGFYIMLHKDTKSNESANGTADATDDSKCCAKEEDDYIFFDSPWLSLVKTATMFVGELEFSDIPVNIESNLSPVSYLFFLSFVFLIVVVLMNLLNGLAVSDTGLIQAKAEIVSYTTQVETISYSESLLLGDPFDFLSNWPAFRWLKNIPPCSIWAPLYRKRAVQSVFNKIFGAKDILLFYSFLPNKTLACKVNNRKGGFEKCMQVDIMDESILLAAKSIVMDKLALQKSDNESEERMKSIENLIAKQDQQIQLIGQKLDLLIQKLA